jgi:hypothetical protein
MLKKKILESKNLTYIEREAPGTTLYYFFNKLRVPKGSKIIGKLRGGKASRERILDSPHYCMHGMGFVLFLREKRLT